MNATGMVGMTMMVNDEWWMMVMMFMMVIMFMRIIKPPILRNNSKSFQIANSVYTYHGEFDYSGAYCSMPPAHFYTRTLSPSPRIAHPSPNTTSVRRSPYTPSQSIDGLCSQSSLPPTEYCRVDRFSAERFRCGCWGVRWGRWLWRRPLLPFRCLWLCIYRMK